ncbi:MAG: biliverdin-producing heme oxygenase, partial [Myxococcota bacterium]
MTQRDAGSPMARLKAATSEAHVATEQTAMARAMAEGALSRRHYGLHLQVFRVLVADLEARREAAGAAGADVWGPERAKLALLEEDLAHLAPTEAKLPSALAALLEKGLPDRLELGALLGRTYVFEGSTLGGAVLAPRLARSPGLAGEPFRYYRCYGDALGPLWKAFRREMNRLLETPARLEAAIAEARSTFAEVGHAFDAAWQVG